MKKTLLIAFILPIALSSCQQIMQKFAGDNDTVNDSIIEIEGDNENEEEEDTEIYQEIKVKKTSYSRRGEYFEFDIDVDYPVSGPKDQLEAIQRIIADRLGVKTNKALSLDDDPLAKVFKTWYDSNKNDINGMQEICEEMEQEMKLTETESLTLIDQTEDYITYELTGYYFSGGAHGIPYDFYFTMNKHTGKLMEWDDYFTKESQQKLVRIIQQEIVSQYFDGDGSDFEGGLPDSSPALTLNGMVFFYGAYEACSFAGGLPCCTIPYRKLKAYMTDEAKDVIPE